jgi:uncharacterized damage-inducible protein DinB
MTSKELADRLEHVLTGPMWYGPPLLDLVTDATSAEATARPIARAHAIAELVGHIAAWAEIARVRLGGEAGEPSPEEDFPPAPSLDGPQWDLRREKMEAAYRALGAAVLRLSPEEMAAPGPGQTRPRVDMIQGVIEHGAYHGGQIALLRRALRG